MAKSHLFLGILTFGVAFHASKVPADEPLLVESSSPSPTPPANFPEFPQVIGPLKFDNELPGTTVPRFVTIPDDRFSFTTLSPDPAPFDFEVRQEPSASREDLAIAEWRRQLFWAEKVRAWPIESRPAPMKHKGYANTKVDLRLIAPALTADQSTKQSAPQVPSITLQVDRAPDVLKPVVAYRVKVVPNNRPLSVPSLIEFRR